MYLTFKNYKKKHYKLREKFIDLRTSNAKISQELENIQDILTINKQQGNTFISFRNAKDGSSTAVFASNHAFFDNFIEILVYQFSKRKLPLFKIVGLCTKDENNHNSLTIRSIRMEKEFRGNGIGSIAMEYLIDWAERENKVNIVVDLQWVNIKQYNSSLLGLLNKAGFVSSYKQPSSVRAEKVLLITAVKQNETTVALGEPAETIIYSTPYQSLSDEEKMNTTERLRKSLRAAYAKIAPQSMLPPSKQ